MKRAAQLEFYYGHIINNFATNNLRHAAATHHAIPHQPCGEGPTQAVAGVSLGFGRIVVSGIEAPNMLAIPV
jgi:hypothetical protein